MEEIKKNIVYYIAYIFVPVILAIALFANGVVPFGWYFLASAIVTFPIIKCESKYSQTRLYYLMIVYELHIFAMSLILGFASGMALYLFPVPNTCILISYIYKKQNNRNFYVWPVALFAAFLFICTCDISSYYFPVISLPQSYIWWLYRINAVVSILCLCSTIMSFKNKAEYYERLSLENANIDILTGLRNRRSLLGAVREEILNANVFCNVSCAIVDIDDFKKLNDIYGHNAGDAVLKCFGDQLIKFEKNKKNFVGRWGGEEFILVSLDSNGMEQIEGFLKKVLKTRRNETLPFKNNQLGWTFTAGITKYHEKDTLDSLINRADVCLYMGKKKGKNTIDRID